jgi:branched-chain amino acid transport system substrate-binding protein
MRRHALSAMGCAVTLWAAWFSAGCARSHPTPDSPVARPFFDLRSTEPNYAGPGREEPDPVDVKEVLIGYFGPPLASHALAGDMWCAACLAMDQANEAGGYRGVPFRLMPAWSDNPWGSGVKELTRLVFEDRVWAIVGGVDGPTTHLAEQIAVKAGLPLLNPVSTDKTVNLTNVPWIFSCTPQDPLQARCLADGLKSRLGPRPFVLVSAVDHDSRLFAAEFQKALTAGHPACASHHQFDPTDGDLSGLVRRMGLSDADTLVLVAGAVPSARFMRALRESGYAGTVFGGPCMGQQAFMAAAGPAGEGVVFPCSYMPSPQSLAFEDGFTRRCGVSADTLAAHTYDAVRMLVAAIRRTGLSRSRIRDAVRGLSPWEGVSGTILWDPPGSNPGTVNLCTIQNGHRVAMDAQGVTCSPSWLRLPSASQADRPRCP